MSAYTELTTKKARIQFIREKLGTDARWAVKALITLFDKQTSSEQCIESTTEANGVGFSAYDAEILSSFAKQVNRGRVMSVKQMALIHKRMPKYSGQLERLSA